MEHNSAKVAKELGFNYKYVLEDFYRAHKDVEKKAKQICADFNEKAIQELKTLVKDYDITTIKEEAVYNRQVENEKARLKKQKFYEQFSLNTMKRKVIEVEPDITTVEKEHAKEIQTLYDGLFEKNDKIAEYEKVVTNLEKQNLILSTENKRLRRELEFAQKEKYVVEAENNELKRLIEREREDKKNNDVIIKLNEEILLLKKTLASPYFTQLKKYN